MTVVNARFVSPMDETVCVRGKRHNMIVTMEENVLRGGFGEAVAELLYEKGGSLYS